MYNITLGAFGSLYFGTFAYGHNSIQCGHIFVVFNCARIKEFYYFSGGLFHFVCLFV